MTFYKGHKKIFHAFTSLKACVLEIFIAKVISTGLQISFADIRLLPLLKIAFRCFNLFVLH